MSIGGDFLADDSTPAPFPTRTKHNLGVPFQKLHVLRITVMTVQDMSANDRSDVFEVFENLWTCVLPWFDRDQISSEADALLDDLLTSLSPKLSGPPIANVVLKHLDQLVNVGE